MSDSSDSLACKEPFEGVRRATSEDVAALFSIIEPLEIEGLLVRRSRKMLEDDIQNFFVLERDALITACAALYAYPYAQTGELACLAVRPEYRGEGRGATLLNSVEEEAQQQGLERMFVLTTHASQWFQDRGFEACALSELPEERRKFYDENRKSRVLMKQLTT